MNEPVSGTGAYGKKTAHTGRRKNGMRLLKLLVRY